MPIKFPESMDECIYFTNRAFENGGTALAWVYKKECPKCHKDNMGKPVEKGKKKIRAKEYVCPSCNFTEEKVEHEESLEVEIQYKCDHCGHEGEATTPYKRKTWEGVKAYVFECGKCKAKIGLTKKMKAAKKK
jgi:predicted RNA-binding Zn-ribbon protein involved in translation (DUF1610 family)